MGKYRKLTAKRIQEYNLLIESRLEKISSEDGMEWSPFSHTAGF
jgi:hypothetical protein